ncbi:hypothetical protein BGZ65_011336 [Modicella reniformis]|uniref:DUF676 domain-containing protein n=1 Tax=Modicella reniformis TaxID=1440133 RepID=A0A9P6M1S2_9FUNG|nr:hypothetical protein BGZ65_011336 [Modicella reniformis]
MPTDNNADGHHLLVLQHGLWGNIGHVRFIAEQFKQRLGGRILVYRARANESGFTYDGVDICGHRVVQEIYSVIKVIETGGSIEEMKGQKLNKHKGKKNIQPDDFEARSTTKKVIQFSYLGYSLGGLIGRFAMGMLDLDGFFDQVEQGGRGEQLQLVDDYIGGKPILLVISESSCVFIHALARFKRRVLYCNIRNDLAVPFWTASFSDADPFRKLDSMEM